MIQYQHHAEGRKLLSGMQASSEVDGATGDEQDGVPEDSEETAPALGPQHVEAALHVKDAGMMLVSTVAPDFTWQSGNANISIR